MPRRTARRSGLPALLHHPQSDLLLTLHSLLDVNLNGRIDSTGARIRTSFEFPRRISVSAPAHAIADGQLDE
jgi:hypothetical protein